MKEIDIYLPTTGSDGRAADNVTIEAIKTSLTNAFGGYTHVKQRCEGAWSMGGVAFRDEITIMRVLDQGDSGIDLSSFKRNLEILFKQEQILIVQREVRVVV